MFESDELVTLYTAVKDRISGRVYCPKCSDNRTDYPMVMVDKELLTCPNCNSGVLITLTV